MFRDYVPRIVRFEFLFYPKTSTDFYIDKPRELVLRAKSVLWFGGAILQGLQLNHWISQSFPYCYHYFSQYTVFSFFDVCIVL